MTKVAVILSGCGHLDGAEIRESVLTLLYLDMQGATVEIFAPDIEQYHVIDHRTQQEVEERRNVLTEAARIARGAIRPLAECNADHFDALLLPGGFGAAKNLSDLAFKGQDATVISEFRDVVSDFVSQRKPIGAICISPAVLAAALMGQASPTVTIGEDKDTVRLIEAFGGKHQTCATDQSVYDSELRIASCSAYMRDDKISSVAKGIEQVVAKVMEEARRGSSAKTAA